MSDDPGRDCCVPGCYWNDGSGPGWAPVLASDAFVDIDYSGMAACPDHVDAVSRHTLGPPPNVAPSLAFMVTTRVCSCGWSSGEHLWFGVTVALWRQHLLAVTTS